MSLEDKLKNSFAKKVTPAEDEDKEPVKSGVENQGTKEGRNQGSLETTKEAPYKPNLEQREEGNTIATNTEIYQDQLEAINLLIFKRSKKGKKTLTKKQFIIEAIDEKLTKELKKQD